MSNLMTDAGQMDDEADRWQMESDVHTLLEAALVLDDPGRVEGVQRVAVEMAEEAAKKSDMLTRIAQFQYPSLPSNTG